MGGRSNSIAFKPGRIGPLEIKNRLVRSATFENAASMENEVTDRLVDMYRTLAEGGVGLIFTGILCVYPGAVSPRQMCIDDDKYIGGVSRISKAVHDLENDCKVMAQLHHPGRQIMDLSAGMPPISPALLAHIERTGQFPQPPGKDEPVVEPTAPSAIFDSLFKRTPRALTLEEIDEIIDAYAEAIRRVQEAGFDGVQLHAAHGWLLSSFLSPHTNRREDEYGGSTENRTRIVRDIYARTRKKIGDDFPILIKINTTDFFPDGTDPEEGARVAEILAEVGFAAIETSGGMWETVTQSQEELGWPPVMIPEARININKKEQEAYFLPGAQAVKGRIAKPVMLVGGIRSLSKVEEVLESGAADFISMARPFLRQPDLPNLWLSGEGPDKAACISCNACLPIGESPTQCNALK